MLAARAIAASLAAMTLLAGMAASAEDLTANSHSIDSVVELFTSQGCSSCPPAERLLTELADEPRILALAYHVDYWDYIGWQDTYGSRDNTERQRAYAQSFGTSTIYTPQMVINGQTDVVGSHRAKVRDALGRATLGGDAVDAELTLTIDGGRLHITADADALDPKGPMPVLMLVTFDDRAEVAVERGENGGRTLVNTHAVRDWRVLGMWSGEPMEIDMPMSMLKIHGEGKAGCAAILQSVTGGGNPGPILAAAVLEFEGR